MTMKWRPGCPCCDEDPDPGSTCETILDGGWRIGRPAVARSIHVDQSGYYNYVEREERVYDAQNTLLSTTVISQTYSNWSGIGQATTTVDETAAYCGIFITTPSDSLISQTLISSTPDTPVVGQRTDVVDVTYQRSCTRRESHGIVTVSDWLVMDSIDSQRASRANHDADYSDIADKPCPRTATGDTVREAYWRQSDRVFPSGFNVPSNKNFEGTLITGISFSSANAVTTVSGVDGLRSGAAKGQASTFEFNTQFNNVPIQYFGNSNMLPPFTANGTDNTITFVMQLSADNGPQGCGVPATAFYYGREDWWANEPKFNEGVRPERCIWDEAERYHTNNEYLVFEVPADSGFKLEYDDDCGAALESVELFNTAADELTTNTPYYQHIVSSERSGIRFPVSLNQDGGVFSQPNGTAQVDIIEHLGYLYGEYPWKEAKSIGGGDVTICGSSYELFNEYPYDGTYVGKDTSVSINVDNGIAPNMVFKYDSASSDPYVAHVEKTPNRWSRGHCAYWPNLQGMPASQKYSGGSYFVRIRANDLHATLCRVKFITYGEAGCPSEIACSTTLAFNNQPNIDRATQLLSYGNSAGAYEADWLFAATGSTTNVSGTPTNQSELWVVGQPEACGLPVRSHFLGSTYNGSDPATIRSNWTISGTQTNATITGNLSMYRQFQENLISGPYTFTIAGIDFTSSPFNLTPFNGQYGLTAFRIILGEDDQGNQGNDKWSIRVDPQYYVNANAAGNIIGGTLTSGTHPYTMLSAFNPAEYKLALNQATNTLLGQVYSVRI